MAEANVTLELFTIGSHVGLRRRRPAILRQPDRDHHRAAVAQTSTFLADGRLAWPVAASRGVSETLFYARLKQGTTPDEVAFTPVMPRGWRDNRRLRP